jgi:hypothetical protein
MRRASGLSSELGRAEQSAASEKKFRQVDVLQISF